MEEHFEGIGEGEFSAVVPEGFDHRERNLECDVKRNVQVVSNLVLELCRTNDDTNLVSLSNLATVFREIMDKIQCSHVAGVTDSQTFHVFASRLRRLIDDLRYLNSYDELGEFFRGIKDLPLSEATNRSNLQLSRVSSANHCDSTGTSDSCSSFEELRAEKDEALHQIRWLTEQMHTLSTQLKEAEEDNNRAHKENECLKEKIVKLDNSYRRAKSKLDREIELKTEEEKRCADFETRLKLRNEDIAAFKEKVQSKELEFEELRITLKDVSSNCERLTNANERLKCALKEEKEKNAFLERAVLEIRNTSTGSTLHSEQNSDYREVQSRVQSDVVSNTYDIYSVHDDYEAEDDVLECIRSLMMPQTKCTSGRDDDIETSSRCRDDADYTDDMRLLSCDAAEKPEEYDDVLVEDTESHSKLTMTLREEIDAVITEEGLNQTEFSTDFVETVGDGHDNNPYAKVSKKYANGIVRMGVALISRSLIWVYAGNERLQYRIWRNSYIILCLFALVLTIICYTDGIEPLTGARSLEFCYLDRKTGKRVHAPQ